MGDGLETVSDPDERVAITRQARRIHRRARWIAAAAALGALLLP